MQPLAPVSNRRRFTLLSPALWIAATLCAVVGWSIDRVDVAGMIADRIGGARGAPAPEALGALRSFPLSGMFFVTAAAFAAFAFVLQRYRAPWEQTAGSMGDDSAKGKDSLWLSAVVCGALVIGRYFSTLPHGYFRYDDFDFVSYAQTFPLREAVWMPHGDHFYPLTRVLASAAVHVFGVTAWPYNLCVLLCFWTVATLGCWLLAVLNISRAGQALFAVLFIFWSPWAEMLGGYYILSIYLFIAALSLAMTLGYRAWRARPRRWLAAFVAACAAAAPLLNTSGWYVPGVLAVILVGDFLMRPPTEAARAWWSVHRPVIMGALIATTAALIVTLIFYRVMNPGLFLSMGAGGTRSLGRLAMDFFYLIDVGLLVSMGVPFVYARLPVPLLIALSAIALLIFGAFVTVAWRVATRGERTTMLTMLAVIAGVALMVNLGRPSGDTLAVRWAAKHVGPAYVWLCLLVAFTGQILWRATSRSRRIVLTEATLLALGLFLVAQTAFGALGLAVSFPPFGYPAEIRDAIERRQNVEDLRDSLVKPLSARGTPSLTIPALDGAYLGMRYPSLFEYHITDYLPFFGRDAGRLVFVRNGAMQHRANPRLMTVPVLRDAISPEFLDALRTDPTLRGLYFQPILLVPAAVKGSATPAPRRVVVESDGTTALDVHRGEFDPESQPLLRLAIIEAPTTGDGAVSASVAFENDFGLNPPCATFQVRPRSEGIVVFDLRQVYAFSLSRRVANLRVVLTHPGRYVVEVGTLTP